MGAEILVAKIVFAAISGIILINIVSVTIGIIGIVRCNSCNPVVDTFLFIVVPLATAFIGVSKVLDIFTLPTRG